MIRYLLASILFLTGSVLFATPVKIQSDSAAWKKLRSDSAFIADSIHLPKAAKLLAFHWSSLPLDFVRAQLSRMPDSILASKYGQEIVEGLKDEAVLEVGSRFPQLTVFTSKGDSVSLYKILPRSSLILVDFWASWCFPCRSNSPDLKALVKRFEPEDLAIVSISMDTDSVKWWQAVLEDELGHWTHVRELSKGMVSQLTGVNFIPRYILIDKDGRVLGKFNGRWKGLYDLEKLIKEELVSK